MTSSSSETKFGPRFGLAAAATGCLAMVLFAALPVRAEDANPVLAKVNGSEIRQSDMAIAEEELGPSLDKMDPATRQENLLAFLIDMKIVSKAAEDKKVESGDEFKRRLAFARNRLLMDSLLAQEGKAATTDEAMKKVYEDAAKQITGEQEVRARHILVETEDEAKAVKAELDKGADFAELAKKKSKDPGASDGGDLGFFTKDQMVPEFSAVAFALEPGKISDPVKSQFGWHIIKVEEKRNRKAPDFEQVKAQIETYVTRKAQADYVAKLREGAKIERLDQAANTPAPAAAPATASADCGTGTVSTFFVAISMTATPLGYDVATLAGMDSSRILGHAVRRKPVESSETVDSKYEVVVTRPDGTSLDLLVSTASIGAKTLIACRRRFCRSSRPRGSKASGWCSCWFCCSSRSRWAHFLSFAG